MKLSKRLEAIYDLVPCCASACDIGCDHGYVAIELASRGRVKKVYGMDINEGPLAKARENVLASGFSSEVELILSDGLKALEKDCETIIIAGMGGALIEKILEEGRDKALAASTLVISPHSEIDLARKKIYDLGFFIEKEVFLSDGAKDYFIIRAKKGDESYACDYKYSEYLIRTADVGYLDFVLRSKKKMEKLIEKVPETRAKDLKEEILKLEEVVDEIKRNRKDI